MAKYSDWRSDLREVMDDDVDDTKVKEKKVNNAKLIKINPKLGEAVEVLGGQLLEVSEIEDKESDKDFKDDAEVKKLEQNKKKEDQLKKRIIRMKLRGLNQGSGDTLVAGHEPEGDQLDERLGGKGYSKQAAASSVYPGKKGTGDWEDSDRGAGNKAARRAGKKVEKKSPTYRAYVLNKEDYETKKTGEVLAAFKRDPKVRKRFEKAAKKDRGPGSVKNQAADSMLQTAKDIAKRKGDTSKSDDRYAYEEVQLEAKVDAGKSPEEKEKVRNVRKFGVSHNVAGHGKLRRALHRSDRGDKKIKGDKSAYVEMEAKRNPNRLVEPRDGVDSAKEVNRATRKAAFRPFNKEDKAYEYVVSKLKKKYGDGVLTKGDKIKPKTAAQKKAAAAHQAKVDRENAAERAKDPSQGRYPKGYSNRGSD